MQNSLGRKLGISVGFTLALLLVVGIAIYLLPEKERGKTSAPPDGRSGTGEKSLATSGPESSGEDAGKTGPGTGAGGETAAEKITTTELEKPKGPPSLQGTIRNAQGDGVPGARIVALNIEDWEGVIRENMAILESSRDPQAALQFLFKNYRKRLEQVARTRSAVDGTYRLYGLKTGNYRILVTQEEYLPQTDLWGEVTNRGEPTTVDAELVQGYSIAGTIVDERGEPVEGARVSVIPSSQGGQTGIAKLLNQFMEMFEGNMVILWDPLLSGKDGSFRASSLQPVTYTIQVEKSGYAEATASRIPAGTEGVVLLLSKGTVITARVLDPDFQPVQGAEWAVKPFVSEEAFQNPMAMIQVELDITGEKTRRGKTLAEGRLELAGLKKGVYDLELKAKGFPQEKYRINVSGENADLGDLVLQKPRSIAGRIWDPEGKPVEGARVWIPGPLEEGMSASTRIRIFSDVLAETRSDAKGNYILNLLPKNLFDVHAAVDGLAETIRKGVEADSRDVDIQLQRGFAMEGRVLDQETRKPIPKVTITLRAISVQKAVTDEEGYFRLQGISAPEGNRIPDSGEFWVYGQIFHPDYGRESKRFSLKQDSDAPPEEILLSRKSTIRGVVVDLEGHPVHYARVRMEIPGVPEIMLLMGPSGMNQKVFSAGNGTFQIQLPIQRLGGMEKRMELVASHPAHSTGRIPLEDLKLEDGSYAGAEIILPPGVSITGKVTDTTGQPVAGAQVSLQREAAMSQSGEALFLATIMPSRVGKVAYSKGSGEYRLSGVEPGTYNLEVKATGYAGKRLGDIDVGEQSVVQNIVLDAGGSLEGLVVSWDGQPLQNIEVSAFLDIEQPDSEGELEEFQVMRRFAGRGSAHVRTGRDGYYTLTHLPDGQFTLVARAAGYMPAEVAGLSPGDRVPDLVLRRLGGLRVKVTAADTGLPILSYTIQIRRILGEGERRSPFDSYLPSQKVEDGEYFRDGLRPGSYRVSVSADRYAGTTGKAEIREGEENLYSVSLQPGFRYDILVLDKETGVPIEGAQVNYHRIKEEGESEFGFYNSNNNLRTGENGWVSIDTLAEGKYSARVSHVYYYLAEGKNPEFEIPRDAGSRIEFQMNLAGRIQGRLSNIAKADFQSVNYHLILRPAVGLQPQRGTAQTEQAVSPVGRSRVALAKSSLPQEQQVWIHPREGTFNQGSLRPGTYDLFLKKRTYKKAEDGSFQLVEGEEEPLPVGTVEVLPGETANLNLKAP